MIRPLASGHSESDSNIFGKNCSVFFVNNTLITGADPGGVGWCVIVLLEKNICLGFTLNLIG